MTPCPTCRHLVLHLDALSRTIHSLRVAIRRRPALAQALRRHRDIGERIERQYADHLTEHRAAIRQLAAHLPIHAERRTA